MRLLSLLAVPWLGGCSTEPHAVELESTAQRLAPAASPRPIDLKRFPVPTADHPDAVCNDGSEYSFYYRPGAPGVDRLHLFFQGGGQCVGHASCAARFTGTHATATNMSSVGWGELLTGSSDGWLTYDGTKLPTGDDHLVFLRYCSSDAWVGTRTHEIDTTDPNAFWFYDGQGAAAPFPDDFDTDPTPGIPELFRFHGAHITETVLDVLETSPPAGMPRLAELERITVSGFSAGSGGVLAHVDEVAARAPKTQVLGVVDAAWLIEHPVDPPPSWLSETIAVLADAQWGAQLDASCMAATPGTLPCDHPTGTTCELAASCLVGELVTPHIDAPLFIAMSQRDGPAASFYSGYSASDLAPAFHASLSAMASSGLAAGVYSRDDTLHGYLGSDLKLDAVHGNEPTAREVVTAFFARPGSPQAYHLSP